MQTGAWKNVPAMTRARPWGKQSLQDNGLPDWRCGFIMASAARDLSVGGPAPASLDRAMQKRYSTTGIAHRDIAVMYTRLSVLYQRDGLTLIRLRESNLAAPKGLRL
jgi:hypothetical protein